MLHATAGVACGARQSITIRHSIPLLAARARPLPARRARAAAKPPPTRAPRCSRAPLRRVGRPAGVSAPSALLCSRPLRTAARRARARPRRVPAARARAAEDAQSDSDAEYALHDNGYEPPAEEPATPARPPLSTRPDASNTEWCTAGIASSAKKPSVGAFARARESLTRSKYAALLGVARLGFWRRSHAPRASARARDARQPCGSCGFRRDHCRYS